MESADDYFRKEKDRSTSAIRRSETELRRVLDSSPFPIIVSTRADRKVLYMNKLASEMFHVRLADLQGKPTPDFFVDPADREHVMDVLEKVGEVDDYEAHLRDGAGREFPALVSITQVEYENKPASFLTFNDITGRKEKETELLRLATVDPLTGVLNRRAFSEQAERELARARRYNNPLSTLMLDIDWFKQINDTMGHAAGDHVLRELSRIMERTLRETDIIGRVGGEEFAAILIETPLQGAVETAERIREAIAAEEFTYEGGPIRITASIGVAEFMTGDKTVEDTLKRADSYLYHAKQSGRNRVMND
ncbi:MAG: sensor domain-containing diguanylate cyclase [Planctomycetes bacterium]|nr:sensor domain-containing diguanylate cyclase [Planctomycetota bacterium]